MKAPDRQSQIKAIGQFIFVSSISNLCITCSEINIYDIIHMYSYTHMMYIKNSRNFIPLDEIWLTYGSWELET